MQGNRFWGASTAALLSCLITAGCQTPSSTVSTPIAAAPAAGPTVVNGVGYILFDAAINPDSSAALVRSFDTYQSKGAREIDLALNSPGGDVDAADSVVAAMDRLHSKDGITFKVWNVKMVASAATLIYLDAQQRSTYPRAGFLFHAPHLVASGTFDAETLRKDADRIDQIAHALRDTLFARTHLTRQQADIYTTRTVVLSADDARNDGVADTIGPLPVAKTTLIWVIRQKKISPPARPAPASG